MEKKSLRTCVGGILLLAGTVANIVIPLLLSLTTLVTMRNNSYFDSNAYIESILITAGGTLLRSLPVIALSVVLLLKFKGIPVVVCSGLATIVHLFIIILASIAAKSLDYPLDMTVNYFILAAHVLMTAVAVIPLVPGMKRLKNLWFIPGVAYSLAGVAYVVQLLKDALASSGVGLAGAYATGFAIGTILGVLITLIPTYGLTAAGYFLAGKWIVDPYKKGYQPQQQAQYQPQYPYQQPAQPQFDEQTLQALNYYKWQYESGAITWEQYNASIQPYLNHYNK